MLKDSGIEVDISEFESCMQKQRELAKASWKGSGDEINGGELGKVATLPQESLSRSEVLNAKSKIAILFNAEGIEVASLEGEGYAMLEKNPFYAQGGGAVGDSGWLYDGEKLIAEVKDTRNFFGKEVCKVVALTPLKTHQEIEAKVDLLRQIEIRKHHSATHLLHAILREVLGEEVTQAGSLVEENRLRFDFSYPKALSSEEIVEIEKRVNALITQTLKAEIVEMSIEEAKAKGAMALFGEKYGDRVRVVSFGEHSCELCGGLHIQDIGMIGNFFILKESGVSSGVRRIEAVCGKAGYEYALKTLTTLQEAKEMLKAQDLLASISKLQEQNKELKEKIKKLSSNSSDLSVEEIRGVKVIISEVQGESKEMIDNLKNKYDKVVVLLISNTDGKITLSAGVKNAPLKAGAWVKEIAQILGGNGGGRDDFATAGGKDASKIAEALQKARLYVSQNIIG